jgi:hypothetical protein
MKTTETIDLAPYWEDIENIAKERLNHIKISRRDYNYDLGTEITDAAGEVTAKLNLGLEYKLDPTCSGPKYIDYKNLRIRVVSTKLSDVINQCIYLPANDPYDYDIAIFVGVDLKNYNAEIFGFAPREEILKYPIKNHWR